MDFEYSPHRSAGGTMSLLSPTHHSKYADPFPSIKQIRRSLSRSPSKPSRFQVYSTKSPKQSPISPRSPSTLSRAYSAESGPDSSSAKPRFTVRRSAPLKAVPRRTSPNSPMRRALSDGINQSNTKNIALPFRNSSSGQENVTTTPADAAKTMRFELDNEPIKFDLLKAHGDKPSSLGAAMRDHLTPAKSSPLKRSDGVMNLDQPNLGSPRAKRRSLHAGAFGNDFNIFEHGFDTDGENWDGERSTGSDLMTGISSPRHQRSPQRRPFSLRKSTLRQRSGSNSSGSRPSFELPVSPASPASSSLPSPGLARTRSRISLDGVLPLRSLEPTGNQPSIARQPSVNVPKPHPLSKALSPSSSAGSLVEETLAPPTAQRLGQRPHLGFSKSLPIGALRPRLDIPDDAFDTAFDSFETPEAYKMARPLPTAFMSTGLISKRNRNIDTMPASFGSSVNMPDTPSKRTFLPMGADTPARPAAFGSIAHPKHEFGSPTTPFSPHALKGSPESFGKGVSIFGSNAKGRLNRRSSFLSIDGDADDLSNSPIANKMDTQIPADELPPTPTKPAHTGPRPQSKGKGNSLRSSLLGRRSSLAPDTFIAPENQEQRNDGKHLSMSLTPKHRQSTESAAASRPPFITFTPVDNALSPTFGRSRLPRLSTRARSPSPLSSRSPLPLSIFTTSSSGDSAEVVMQTVSAPPFSREGSVDVPVTPSEAFTPPDASRLSISGNEPGRNSFATSANGLPPATPTGPRDHPFNFSISNSLGGSSVPQNDVDTTITARFGSAQVNGSGEFSIVYRVENPLATGPAASLQTPSSVGKVWAVKKSKKPYSGSKDRARKMKEVQILKALRGHEHIIEVVDTWEMKNHLYIQTEFCENGNLKLFLEQAGYKARIDDFRIWKILLELSLGIESIHKAGYIHLDLKPANIFIDWEGVLKIGDFGMASVWPAPPHLDGEGDREYIAPEALSGRFDKPADVFTLGMIMLEIAGNIVLPDNGISWQRLRAGDMSDLPSLTFSTESSLVRDESGDPVNMLTDDMTGSTIMDDENDLGFDSPRPVATPRPRDLVQPPAFMVDSNHEDALEHILQLLTRPNPDERPTIEQVLAFGGVQWVAARRRAGATIYEGNWGPADDTSSSLAQDIEMAES